MTWREDKTLLVLAIFTVFFAAITLFVTWLRPSDGQLYQTFVTQLAGFSGALMMHLKGDKVPPAGSVTDTQVHQRTEIPPVLDPPPVEAPPIVRSGFGDTARLPQEPSV